MLVAAAPPGSARQLETGTAGAVVVPGRDPQGELEFFGDLVRLLEGSAFTRYIAPRGRIKWNVYAKRPFRGVAAGAGGSWTLHPSCRDRQQPARCLREWPRSLSLVMTLEADEFIRHFLLHVLPKGFRRIRHFGFLANARSRSFATFPLCLVVGQNQLQLRVPIASRPDSAAELFRRR